MNRRHHGAFYLLLASLLLIFAVGCSEESSEEGEFDNWEAKNNAAVETWAASPSLRKIKTYSKNASTTGAASDYIYVEVLASGTGDASPYYTDTVRVAYRGHYIPTATYPEGYVFDQTFIGDFAWNTATTTDFLTGGVVDGFATALMNMHVGDYWRVYIPYNLGYGNPSSRSGIYDASNLVFEIAMVDFWHPGDTRPSFRARLR